MCGESYEVCDVCFERSILKWSKLTAVLLNLYIFWLGIEVKNVTRFLLNE